MRKWCVLLLIAVPLAAGCASDPKTAAKPVAVKRWNDARSAVLLSLARDEYNNQNFQRSRQTIDEAIRLSPDNAASRVLSAKLYIEQGQLEAAEHELATARQLAPTNAEADYLSGVIYQRWQQPERALEFYQHACDKAPADLAYLLAKAEMLVAMDRRAEALSVLEEKVTYFEHSGVIRDEVGLLLIQQGRPAEAVEMFRRASILAPDDATIREHLGMSLYYAQRYADAIDVLGPLLKDSRYAQRADLWLTLGECQLNFGHAGEAVTDLQLAAAAMPNAAGIWLSLARAQMQLGNLRGADVALRRSVSLDSDNPQSHLLMGYLRLRQGRYGEALTAFGRSSQLDPSDTVSLCMIGYTLEKLGRNEQAMKLYERALKLKPQDEMATQLIAGLNSHE
ncbi:MAG: tetratricopeptide repeat protein [Tepidisphaeraceae bacterium]|jgi:Flp pilus assembly protein TadD